MFILQVFQTFTDGFGEAYKPLLMEIQQAFDASIVQGLQDALENCSLRQQLLEAGRQQAEAEAAVTAEIISGQCCGVSWGLHVLFGSEESAHHDGFSLQH
jgi:hypothetical protein